MIENRKFIRLHAPIGISFKPVRKHRRVKVSRSLVRNLSGGGVRFATEEALRCGDLLELEIHIPHLARPIRAVGEVVWFGAGKERDSDGREAGVRFRDIEAADMNRILEYVYVVGIG